MQQLQQIPQSVWDNANKLATGEMSFMEALTSGIPTQPETKASIWFRVMQMRPGGDWAVIPGAKFTTREAAAALIDGQEPGRYKIEKVFEK